MCDYSNRIPDWGCRVAAALFTVTQFSFKGFKYINSRCQTIHNWLCRGGTVELSTCISVSWCQSWGYNSSTWASLAGLYTAVNDASFFCEDIWEYSSPLPTLAWVTDYWLCSMNSGGTWRARLEIKWLPKPETRAWPFTCLQQQQARTGEPLQELTPEHLNGFLQWSSSHWSVTLQLISVSSAGLAKTTFHS